MALKFQLSNSNNWRKAWESNYQFPGVDGKARKWEYNRIDILFQFDTPFLVVYPVAFNNPGYWKKAGYIQQRINTGITWGGNSDTDVKRRYLELSRLNLVQFDLLSSSYALHLLIVPWITSLDLFIWEYTGTTEDTLETKLTAIQDDLRKLIPA